MDINQTLPYDPSSPQSILDHASLLLNKSLRDLYPNADENAGGKGGLGQIVESLHFGYQPNSESQPDFNEAGLELKCTPLKTLANGNITAKERLVLNIINYMEEADKTFETSSFRHKNAHLLLMFYLHREKTPRIDLVFKLIRDWRIPETDLKIFIDDWNKIHEKITAGKAHELSEGETLYLAASIKGSKGGANKRQQPGSKILADQRAYSIKRSYMDAILLQSIDDPNVRTDVTLTDNQRDKIRKHLADCGSVVTDPSQYQPGQTFEDLVIDRFKPFYGKTIEEIEQTTGTGFNPDSKSLAYDICRAILGVKQRHISEFEKAGIMLKSVRLEADRNHVKESMSFPAFSYLDIAAQQWEESDWYGDLTSRFLFAVFRKSPDGDNKKARLEKLMFWAMPADDLEAARTLWLDTQQKIINGDYDNFITSKSNPVCHVRPHARDNNDTAPTPQGNRLPKKSFWLNNDYILNVIQA